MLAALRSEIDRSHNKINTNSYAFPGSARLSAKAGGPPPCPIETVAKSRRCARADLRSAGRPRAWRFRFRRLGRRIGALAFNGKQASAIWAAPNPALRRVLPDDRMIRTK
jgi:hypothetical protein